MTGLRQSGALLVALLAPAVLGSCKGGTDEGTVGAPDLLLATGQLDAVDPGARLGPASRLELVDAVGEARAFGPDDRAVGNANVSWTGKRVLAAARREGEERARIWSLPLGDGTGEEIELGPLDCGSADELPDGRLVVAARTAEPPPTPELLSGWALWVHDPGQGTTHRITYGLAEIDPAVLADGRIVYAGWQPGGDGRGPDGAFALFTVHPDGSGVAPFHGHHDGPRWKLRPRELANGDVVVLAGDGVDDLRPLRVDRRHPGAAALPIEGPQGGELRTVARAAVAADLGLGRDGRVVELPAGRVIRGASNVVTDVLAAVARSRPQGHLSMIDPDGDRGQIFLVDARPLGAGSRAASLRVRAAAVGREEKELGLVELASDGSLFVEVPANVRLWLDVLDGAGNPLAVSQTPIWVRPNEKRGCVGCHEDAATAPPNRRPEAVLADPVDLTGGMS